MKANVAVVAHFDASHSLSQNFRHILEALELVFDKVLLVTTCELEDGAVDEYPKTTLIKRPNIGYDFYSYRVGIHCAKKQWDVQCLLITNSSYFLTSRSRFTALLQRLVLESKHYDVVGLTESRQFSWHLQSYMMLLGREVLYAQWFSAFIHHVNPVNSKIEIIFNYEIGLSTLLKKNTVRTTVLYVADWRTEFVAKCRWLRRLMIISPVRHVLNGSVWGAVNGINWTHFAAQEISDQYGVIKSEVFRTNPLQVNVNSIKRGLSVSVMKEIEHSLVASRGHYQVSVDGLSEFCAGVSALPLYRSVLWGQPRADGVRVAVVIHLYYVDLLDEILRCLTRIAEPFDLYVTTPFEADVVSIIDHASSVASSITVHVTENRGRDIGPFLSLYLEGWLDSYTAVLKLHSKKSRYSAAGDEWRKSIYHSLMGSSLIVAQVIHLLKHKDVGIVGPHRYYLSHDRFWGANKSTVTKTLSALGVPSHQVATLGFFAGSMFWFSPKALAPLKTLPPSYFLFPEENGLQDGTVAHAFERMFCPLSRFVGLKTSSLELGGEEINDTRSGKNTVPVL